MEASFTGRGRADGMFIYTDTVGRRGKSVRENTQGFFGTVAGRSRNADVNFSGTGKTRPYVTEKRGNERF